MIFLPFTATVLIHSNLFTSVSYLLFFAPQVSFCVFHSIFPLTPPLSHHCASHCSPPPKRKWENGKSCCLLWHPCLPTHNAVFRFVQLPRSLLVCTYPSTTPTLHLSLITQQRHRMLHFQLQNLVQCCSTTTNPLIVIVVCMWRGVCQSGIQTESETDSESERNACQCCIPTNPNSRLGSTLSWEGFQQDTFFYLDGWW